MPSSGGVRSSTGTPLPRAAAGLLAVLRRSRSGRTSSKVGVWATSPLMIGSRRPMIAWTAAGHGVGQLGEGLDQDLLGVAGPRQVGQPGVVAAAGGDRDGGGLGGVGARRGRQVSACR